MSGRTVGVIGAGVVVLGLVAAQERQSESAPAPAAEDVRVTDIRLRTGVTLQVAQRGRMDGEPVLFLHGYTDSWVSYTRLLDVLPGNVRAIVPSHRGHGDSERPVCCYTVADFAADAVALLDTLGIAQATIVGHSMGSLIAQRLAIEQPARVRQLVLIGSGTTANTPDVQEFNTVVQQLKDPIPTEFVRDFQVSTLFKPIPPAFLDRIVRESEKLPARVWRDVLAALLSPSAQHDLSRIRTRTLVMWGEHDMYWKRSTQDALMAVLPNARLLTYAELGHSPHWEDPARFGADLIAFMNEATTSPAITREQVEHAGHTHGTTQPGPMPLLPGLGDWQHRVTTTSAEAQRYFDQGLRLSYAFNHAEAARSFERAVQLDPACAMCYWGSAYAVGPNINLPLTAEAEALALAAIGNAVRLQRGASALERALIAAQALRYGEPAGAARAARDSAYATAMRRVAERFPADVDAQVLFADAMLNLRPWNQWTRDGKPQPGTLEAVAALERALERAPEHAGACHFYVHAVEASETPDRALPCAERLGRLMPGAGHIVHMPAHVYLRVGRYEDAARANIAAVAADNHYFAQHEVTGVYPMFYAPHNLHFLWAAYLLSGQRAKALQAARTLTERVAVKDAREIAALQAFLPAAVLTLTRFRDWDAVLAEPAPPADLRYAKAMWHYARGVALAERADMRGARVELDSVRTIGAQVKDDMIIILNPAPALLRLAAEVLAGQMAMTERRYDVAIAHFDAGVRMEDALSFDEPPAWYHSVRNLLGEALLAAGRAVEAEQAFRQDLRYVRENGWSLSGLQRALRAQGNNTAAAVAEARLRQAWKHADTPAPGNMFAQYGTKRPGGTR